jgi:hypothetical protein
MADWIRHLHRRELRFLAFIAVSVSLIALYLSAGLRLAGDTGSGWRSIDLDALQRRIETGELRDREARWYHPSTPEETGISGERP